MVVTLAIVAQLVRALDCGSKSRGFKSRRSPIFMNPLEAILLGLIQGITEFLPVSSSAHLSLAQHFLGFKNLQELVFFDLICHLGTLLAIVVVFFKEIQALSKQTLKSLVIATLPLFPLLLIIKPLKNVFNHIELLGFFFLITSLLLFLSEKKASPKLIQWSLKKPWLQPLLIGCFQAAACLPGISRSGSTISAAKMLGWKPDAAITFSFLLGLIAILGGFTLELITVIKHPVPIEPIPYAIGFLTSFLAGWAALKLLIRIATKKNLLPFAWYCLILGLVTLLYFYG